MQTVVHLARRRASGVFTVEGLWSFGGETLNALPWTEILEQHQLCAPAAQKTAFFTRALPPSAGVLTAPPIMMTDVVPFAAPCRRPHAASSAAVAAVVAHGRHSPSWRSGGW